MKQYNEATSVDNSRAYFCENDYKNGEKAQEANLIGNVTARFPASYISDGNTHSFGPQAEENIQKTIVFLEGALSQ
ncbi:MAG: hypothetical protein IJ773_07255 [Lachnospiraceae bacterium]|nr:hypothetical protein [Lachnospiraceae bacterium]